MEPVDIDQVPRPIGYVRDDHQVHQDGEELVSRDGHIYGRRGEGVDGVTEAVQLLQGRGELVELGQDGLCLGDQQSGMGRGGGVVRRRGLEWGGGGGVVRRRG